MANRSPLITILKFIRCFLPGDYIKTVFYLSFIKKPRKYLRLIIESFYRADHIYDVIKQARDSYDGNFSILEFGVSHGHSFVKMLYAVKYLGMANKVIVHGFDSFEGLPSTDELSDKNIVGQGDWVQGQFKSEYDKLNSYCQLKYNNFKLHRGYFQETLTEKFLESLKENLPILVWIDCDYYSSAKDVFEKLLAYLPSGCVIYFDDYDFNYGSKFTGEARLVDEVNRGEFGDGFELVLDRELSLNSTKVYRFINIYAKEGYVRRKELRTPTDTYHISNDSPFP